MSELEPNGCVAQGGGAETTRPDSMTRSDPICRGTEPSPTKDPAGTDRETEAVRHKTWALMCTDCAML